MNVPSEFDDIRPFEPEELPAVYERLIINKQFQAVVKFLYPMCLLRNSRKDAHV
jgi:hypothetical protein